MEIKGLNKTPQQTKLTPQQVGGAAGFLIKTGKVSSLGGAAPATSARPQARITPEAARELLKQHQGKLGGIMTAALQGMAGPVKRPASQK